MYKIILRKDLIRVESLLTANVDCHVTDGHGQTACHVAAEQEASEILSKIVEARRGMKWTRDEIDRTPLDISVERRDLKSARICIKGSNNGSCRLCCIEFNQYLC